MENIVKEIFNHYGYVFGGYVRDFLAGVQPRDIDCVIPDNYLLKFLKSLSALNISGISIKDSDPEGDFYYEGNVTKLSIHRPGVLSDILVDIVRNPLQNPDFDVNMLKMDERGISVMEGCYLDFSNIWTHIRERQCEPYCDARPHRIKKMRMKGWKIIGVGSK